MLAGPRASMDEASDVASKAGHIADLLIGGDGGTVENRAEYEDT